MRDNDELRICREVLQIRSKSIYVCIVERRFDFVENTEGHRLGFQDSEQNRNRSQSTFAARQQGNLRQLLTRRTSHDFYACRKGIFHPFVVDLKFRFTAAKQFFKGRLEVFVEIIEPCVEDTEHFIADLFQYRLQVVNRLLQVVTLPYHFITTGAFFVVFFHSVGVHRAEHGNLTLQGGNHACRFFHVEVFHTERKTAFVIQLVRFFHTLAGVFERGVDFTDFDFAFITLVRALRQGFLQIRLFFFQGNLFGVDGFLLLGNRADFVHNRLYSRAFFFRQFLVCRFRFQTFEFGFRFRLFVFHIQNTLDEVFLFRGQTLDRFLLLFKAGRQSGVFHFHFTKRLVLDCAFFLEAFALTALAFHFFFHALTTRSKLFFAERGVRFFVFEFFELTAQFRHRALIGFDVVFRFGKLLRKRRFTLSKPCNFAACALVLFTQMVYRFFRFLSFLFAARNRRFQLFNQLLLTRDVVFTFLNFTFVGKERACVSTTATTRHRTARRNGVTVKGNDFEQVAVLLRNRRCVRDVVANKRIAQQVADYVVVVIVVMYELGCQAHRATFVERTTDFLAVGTGTHACYGQEGYDTAVGTL